MALRGNMDSNNDDEFGITHGFNAILDAAHVCFFVADFVLLSEHSMSMLLGRFSSRLEGIP